MRISTKGTFGHSVHPPPPPSFLRKGGGGGGGGGWTYSPIFKKGRLDKTSVFRWGGAGKQGMTFFRGGVAVFRQKIN